MRTREQQIKDMEDRFAEIKAESERRANDPAIQMPCETCRWKALKWSSLREGWQCTQPLVVGYSEEALACWEHPSRDYAKYWEKAELCGPEKALWEPEPTIRQRILEWLERFLG